MKTSLKNRVLAMFLAVLMIIPVVPGIAFDASAATTTSFKDCTVADLGLNATNANGSGSGENAPVCSWTASGTNINGSLVGGKDPVGPQTYYYESTSTLTITNNKTSEAELSFKYSVTTSGSAYGDITVNGAKKTSSTTGEVSETLAAGAKITVVLHVPERKKFSISGAMPDPNGASISITDIKLVAQGNATINFAAAENGSYTVSKADGTAVTVPGSVAVKTTDRLTMTATPASGYVFSGWYNVTTGKYLSADLTYTTLFESDATVTAKFMKQADGVYGVGNAVFTDLTAAATAAVASSAKTVVLLKSATLTGSHTIPMGVTLLIPYDAAHTLSKAVPVSETVNHSSTSAENYVKYEKPSAFRTLTMTDGSELIIEGEMSVNAKHESCVGGQIYGGQVLGKYGEIKMNGNSKITVKNGATVYAWGYIWGSGTVEALSGSTVYEKMQVTDYRGGSNTSKIALRNGFMKTDGAFPFNQYYIQNVEVEEILHEGAKLMAHAAVNLSGETPAEAAVEFIGSSSAMFTVQGAVITKEYHPETDRLSLSVDGDENSYCEINGMKLSMGTLSIDSANYTLPINSNIDININAGTAVVNQELVLQPGVKVVVGSDAMLANNANVYIMDLDQWGEFVFSGKRQQAVVYTPSLNKASTRTINSDAVMDINGYVMPIAGVYTTAGGAQIISSERSGMIEFGTNAAADSTVAQLTGGSDVNNIKVTSAQLKNGGLKGTTFVATKGATEGTVYAYCSVCDVWATEDHECAPAPTVYNITWMNGTTPLGSQEVEAGTVPSFIGANPTKVPDANGHYTFAGWKTADGKALAAVEKEETYYAQYTLEAHADTDKVPTDGKHYCDTCNYLMNSCSDSANDGDHVCDYGCGRKLSECSGGTATCTKKAVCTECKNEYGSVDANAHDMKMSAKKVEPKCETAGKEAVYTCANGCGKTTGGEAIAALEHNWNDGVIDPDPTCTNAGVKTFTCSLCNGTKTEAVSAKGHTKGDVVVENKVEATCTTDGSYQNVVYCTVCKAVISRDTVVVTQTGHKLTQVAAKAPTCTEAGYEAYEYCSACDYTTYTAVEATGHKYESVVTAPTCEAKGYTTYTCACGDSYVGNYVDATGHSFTNYVSNKDATCTVDGTKTAKCDRCDETKTVTDEGSALGHKYNKVVTAPTCTADGYTTYTCACGDTYKADVVAALGHKAADAVIENNVDPTCTATGSYDSVVYCSVCGVETSRVKTTVDALGHKGDEAVIENKVAPTCTADGSYDTVVYCSVCDAEISRETTTVDANGHAWDEGVIDPDSTCTAEGTKTYTCSACGTTKTEVVSVKGHTPAEAVTENKVAPTCTADGSYDTVVYCSVCDAEISRETTTVDANGHKYESKVTAPTCTANGYTTYTCACGDTYKADEVTALGHTDGSPRTENHNDPTCTATGSYDKVVYCSVCGDEISRKTTTVPANGHGFVDGFTYENTNDGKHIKTCRDCRTYRETVDHSYNADTHKCVCGAVEEFKLCICYLEVEEEGNWEYKEKFINVPYGAKISDIDDIKNASKVAYVNDGYSIGKQALCGWAAGSFETDSEGNPAYNLTGLTTEEFEELTMPADDYAISPDYTFTGWELSYDDNGNEIWSYYREYESVQGWQEISESEYTENGTDSAWYYFKEFVFEDEAGEETIYYISATGITRAPYPTEKIDGVTYAPDQETLDYCASKGKEFIDADKAYFVFDEDGKFNAVTGIVDGNRYAENGMISWHPGLVEVNGELYYFIGDVENGGNTPANGDVYLTRSNGIEGFNKNDVYNFVNGKLSGISGVANGNYYENSKLMMGNGLTAIKVNGETKYIYVRSTGKIVADAECWIGNNSYNIVPGMYAFDSNGYMIDVKSTDKNGIFYENGGYYFYENGAPAYKGLINYNGKADNGTVYENAWIYVRSNGQLATGAYWTTKNDSGLQTKIYNFDETGIMIRTNGIVEENGNLYYYSDGVKQKGLGLIEYNGNYYYVRTAGELVRGREYWISNVNKTGVVAQNYKFDNNGVMQAPVFSKPEATNGVVDGFYYENGKIAYGAGLVELDDGSIIYVRSNGRLATGYYWPTTLNGVLPAGQYNFGADGRLVTA